MSNAIHDEYGFVYGEGNINLKKSLKSKIRNKRSNFNSRISAGNYKTNSWDQYSDFGLLGDDELRQYCKILIRTDPIPNEIRGDVWFRTSGARALYLSNMHTYDDLLVEKGEVLNLMTNQIQRDLHRTLPDNVFFSSDLLQKNLRNILHSYSWYNPEIGYCQSMNFWTGFLLLFLDEVKTFWTVINTIHYILPPNYYTSDMRDLQIDLLVFKSLLKEKLPRIHEHICRAELDTNIFVISWFLCIFSSVLPHQTAIRFLDCFFNEGYKMLFRGALALFKLSEKRILETETVDDLFLLLSKLPSFATSPQEFLDICFDPLVVSNLKTSKLATLRQRCSRKYEDAQITKHQKRKMTISEGTQSTFELNRLISEAEFYEARYEIKEFVVRKFDAYQNYQVIESYQQQDAQ